METHSSQDKLYQDFLNALEQEDKPLCVKLALDALDRGEVDLVGLYTKILAPALNQMTFREEERHLAIWKEHIRSAIVRTILECSYPYLLRELDDKGISQDKGTVVIVSPSDEYHEIGARMGSDFFNLAGYRTVFVGSNTPREDLLEGVRSVQPTYVVISATNTYSLVNARKVIDALKAMDPTLKILASGHAFRQDPKLVHSIGAVGFVQSMEDVFSLGGKV